MGLSLDNISDEEMNKMNSIKNPPTYEAGDGLDIIGDDSDSGFDFDNLDDLFENNDKSGDTSSDWADNQLKGGGDELGENNNKPVLGFNNNNNANDTGARAEVKPTLGDKVADFSADGLENTGKLLVEVAKSVKNRTADDLGFYGQSMIKIGLAGIGIAIILCVVSLTTGLRAIGIRGVGGTIIKSFALCGGFGAISLGIAAIAVERVRKSGGRKLADMPDAGDAEQQGTLNEYMNDDDDLMSSLFDDDDDWMKDDPTEEPTFEPAYEPAGMNNGRDSYIDEPIEIPVIPEDSRKEINYEDELGRIASNGIMNRRFLLETFSRFLPENNSEFSVRNSIDKESMIFTKLEANCLKALSNVLKCELEEVKSFVLSIDETYFSYEIMMKRVKGMNKLTEFEREIEAYVRDDPRDASVTAGITIVGDYYKIVITKGVQSVITLGDCLKQKEVYDFYLNEKNRLPITTGVTELGEIVTDDAKSFTAMMITGKARSGKSWSVMCSLLSMMMFNTPEDVQFILVDPKESNAFNTLGLMPHVCGLHNADSVLDVLDDLLDNEGPRRKKLLMDNHCDDIWAARDKGIKIPVLILFIDEFITAKGNLEGSGLDKEFNTKLRTVITQLPSLGIKVMFVAHRATGIVDKTSRTMLDYVCSVRANNKDVDDALDIKGWKHALVNPGDMAVKTNTRSEAIFCRGLAVTNSDGENAELIENIAKGFYKIGVDIPDMSTLKVAANRDEDKIRKRLTGQNRRIQYDNWEKELEELV